MGSGVVGGRVQGGCLVGKRESFFFCYSFLSCCNGVEGHRGMAGRSEVKHKAATSTSKPVGRDLLWLWQTLKSLVLLTSCPWSFKFHVIRLMGFVCWKSCGGSHQRGRGKVKWCVSCLCSFPWISQEGFTLHWPPGTTTVFVVTFHHSSPMGGGTLSPPYR